MSYNNYMADYNNMLDMILTSHLLQKKQGNILKANGAVDMRFNNLLNQSLEKLQAGNNETMSLKPSPNPSTVNSFNEALKFVLKQEGEQLVHRDGGSGESSKYGILQSTAREYGYNGNIKNLTLDDAKVIYRKIWDKSGASSLPPALSVVHFDTYVNSPAMAKKLLSRSNKDINAYLKMREQRYVGLAERKPDVYEKYLKGWKSRIESLRVAVAGLEGTNKSRHV
jgi:lysozyme family protein